MKKKHIFLSFVFVMMFLMLGKVDANAATALKSHHYTNPYYEDVVGDTVSKDARTYSYMRNAKAVEYTGDRQQIAETLRKQLVERKTDITLYYHCEEEITQEFFDNLSEQLFQEAVRHTGNGNEGDYLRWHYQGWTVDASYSGTAASGYDMQIVYKVTYLSDASQEKQVTEKVSEVLEELNLADKTDYQKVKAIYDYICSNVTYDYKNLDDDTYILKYSAYAALINKTSVCQGYATLFYRMALEAGVDTRVISGYAGEAHAWNIVKIGEKYYNLDSTWDSGRDNYAYFLKNMEDFSNHARDEEYNTSSFTEAYPVAEKSYENACEINGHDLGEWTVKKEAGCTENGERIRKCSRCDYSESEEIPATGHNYVDGICTKCGQNDPEWTDDTYELRYITVNNRTAWYYANSKGQVNRSYTGVTTNGYGWWLVRNGEVDFTYTGLGSNEAGWWRIVNGAVDFNCTSVVNSEYGWWFVRDGYVDFAYTGVAQNENGWWRIVNGAVDFNCTSVVNSEYGWWYIRNGQIDFTYTGVAQNENGWWRIVNGAVDFNCTSVVNSEYGWWFVRNGQIDFTYTGVAQNEFGWWRIENGALNFGFTGLAQNEYGWWYIKNGQLDFSYTGYVSWYGTSYRVQNGQVMF